MINVKQKIFISLFVMISILIAVFKIFETSLRQIADLKDAIGLARKLNQEIFHLRKSEKNFFAFKTKYLIKKFESRKNTLQYTLGCIKEKRIGVVVEMEEQIENALKEYRDAFYNISECYSAIGLDYNSGLRGDVYDYSTVIYKMLSASQSSDLLTKFLILHNKEMELLTRKTSFNLESFEDSYHDTINTLINNDSIDNDTKDIFHQKIISYKSSVIELFNLEAEIDTKRSMLSSNLTRAAHNIEDLLLRLEELLIEELLSADKEVTVKSTLLMVLLALGFISLAIVPFLIFLTVNKHR